MDIASRVLEGMFPTQEQRTSMEISTSVVSKLDAETAQIKFDTIAKMSDKMSEITVPELHIVAVKIAQSLAR